MVDSMYLHSLIAKDPLLSHNFLGCFACNNFPSLYNGGPSLQQFMIVNTEPETHAGQHWLLIAGRGRTVLLDDSFGRNFELCFPEIFGRLKHQCKSKRKINITQFYPNHVFLQPAESELCGIYCVYMAHYFYRSKTPLQFPNHNIEKISISDVPLYASEHEIVRFIAANFGDCVNKLFNLLS